MNQKVKKNYKDYICSTDGEREEARKIIHYSS